MFHSGLRVGFQTSGRAGPQRRLRLLTRGDIKESNPAIDLQYFERVKFGHYRAPQLTALTGLQLAAFVLKALCIFVVPFEEDE